MAQDLMDLDSAMVRTPGGKQVMAVAAADVALDVALQDQTSRLIDRFVTRKISVTTLTAPVAFDDRVVNVAPGHGFVAEDMIEIEEGPYSFQASVISVATNALTVNSPLCRAFSVAAIVRRTNPNLNIDGSVTPVIFTAKPPAGVRWDINILSLNMLDDTDMDDGKFGGITMLSRGVVYRTVDGDTNNIFNSRNNGCFRRHCDQLEYSPKAPAGQYGLHAVRYFNSQRGDGVARRIGGDEISEFQAVVADNLTGLAKFFVVVRGHVVED